jgi:hypothetical protein
LIKAILSRQPSRSFFRSARLRHDVITADLVVYTCSTNVSPLRFHFDAVAHDNDAQSSTVLSVGPFPTDVVNHATTYRLTIPTPTPTTLSGTQKVAKFNRASLDEIFILLALWRVEAKNVDLVLTFNIPLSTEDGGGVDVAGQAQVKKQFEEAVKSLKMIDFGLFA